MELKSREYRAVAAADIPAMAELLIARQALESGTFPFLQNGCCSAGYAAEALQKLFAGGAVGVGAFAAGEPLGYLIGEIRDDPLRGRHIWVPYEGMAVKPGQTGELVRSLYAEASMAWLERGCFMHYAIVPLGGRMYFDAFQRLSFFIQQAHGVLDLAQYRPFASASDAPVRIANKADREKMGRLSGVIQSYQNAAPVFELVLPEIAAQIKAGYENAVEDEDVVILLAETDGEELGFQMYEAAAPGLMSPDGGAELVVAGTYPSRMGAGVGKRLMNEGATLMKARGVRHIASDWRVANLASSTFWPKCGFQTVAYRMVRSIDGNWARAGFDAPAARSGDAGGFGGAVE